MSEWREVKLGAVLPFKYGKNLPEEKRSHSGEHPVVSSAGFIDTHSNALTTGPAVVIGRKGSIGSVFYSPRPVFPIDTTFYVEGSAEVELRFGYYLLKSLPLSEMNTDAAVPGLKREYAENLSVLIPSPGTQRAIVNVLGAIDDLIENNRRRVELLEQMARAIYREWFVNFRYPGHEDVPLVDSALGPIPQAWEHVRLGDIADARRGLSWDRTNEQQGGTPIVTIPNLQSHLVLEGCTELTGVSGEDLLRFRLMKNDILLIGSNGNPARVGHAVLVLSDLDVLFASFLMRVRVNMPRANAGLLFHQLTDPKGVISTMRAAAVGSTGLRNLRITMLRDLIVQLPTKAVIDAFAETSEPLQDETNRLLDENKVLSNLRDMLLPKLVTGEIDVSKLDLDELLSAAVGV